MQSDLYSVLYQYFLSHNKEGTQVIFLKLNFHLSIIPSFLLHLDYLSVL